jgi:putative nucleotidyltransferase with HDIG domain
MDEVSSPRPSVGDRIKVAWHTARLWLIFALGTTGTVLVLSLPAPGQFQASQLAVDEVAAQDIAAPYNLSYSSEVLTDQARQAAADAVPQVFDPPDSTVARTQVELLRAALDFADAVRADAYSSREQRLADLYALGEGILDEPTASAILDLPESRWQAVRLEAIAVLEEVMRSEIREGQEEEARRALPALVSISLPEDQASLVIHLASAYVAPNALFNAEATERAVQAARAGIQPVVKSYASGETIISRGQVVSALQFEAMESFGLLRPANPWPDIAVRLLFVVLLASAVALFAYRLHQEQIRSTRLAMILAVGFIVTAIGLQLMIPGRTVLPYLYPAATFPILLATLFGPGMGVVVALAQGALAGFLAPRGLELGLYLAFGGIFGALMIGRAERLGAFFWAGLAADLACVAAIVVFRLPDPATDALGKATLLGAAIVNGLLSASLSFGLLFMVSSLLGITTNLQLIELSRPDHPLLQFILRSAPGTYQHSLQVANLAEQAARAIGANSLLVRVGALYHDAGKALRPQFYIENQVPGKNIHEQLDPATSASIIVSHIKDGLELARKHRLPATIRAFIPEHHGTLEASFQYLAAIEAAGGSSQQVDRRDFAYPGPRPRTREAALLMLADGVEAKARAENPSDDDAIDQLARWVIQDRLSKGQLDRTDLTLKDLDTIRRSFVATLKGIYHPRLRYPRITDSPESEVAEQKAETESGRS